MTHFSKVQYLTDPAQFRAKEHLYLEARRREARILTDEAVRALPFVPESSPYAGEWRLRRRSLGRLRHHLAQQWRASGSLSPFRILDLGCGNGWMANRLAENPEWDVWAVDLNAAELTQGARLFGRKNLHFAYADLVSPNAVAGIHHPGTPFGGEFDVAVLAASVQYFPDLEALVASLKKRLKPGGAIHIIDSPFYKNESERAAARQRTLAYYTRLGVPEMAAFYHHHLRADVQKSGGVDLNNPLTIRFLQKIKWLAPFPWVLLQDGFSDQR